MSALFKPGRRALCFVVPAMLALSLGACDTEEDRSVPPRAKVVEREFGIPSSQPPSIEAVRKDGRGFTVGPVNSPREVFIFFDPKCSNCAQFWGETQQLTSMAKFTWLPVAVRGAGSATYGAALLDADDKSAAMAAIATKLLIARNSGMQIQQPLKETGSAERLADIARNTQLLKSFSTDGVPYLLMAAPDGTIMTQVGGMSADKLATALGLTSPRP